MFLLSGGHSQCVAVTGIGQHQRLGGTVDDAVGEAFDKVAKLLDLGWPGGPALEAIAVEGIATRFAFPRPMMRRPGCDLSFSGLKTAVAQTVMRLSPASLHAERADIAASFQQAVVDVLADRASHAMGMMRMRHPQANLLVISGGVASNRAIRCGLEHAADKSGFNMLAPPVRLCSDNAVMVAWAGVERMRCGLLDPIEFQARPRWTLESLSSRHT